MVTVYSKIENLCSENGITMQSLSRKADVDRRTMDHWKEGVSSPRVFTLKRIADYFGVKVDDLLPESNARRKD